MLVRGRLLGLGAVVVGVGVGVAVADGVADAVVALEVALVVPLLPGVEAAEAPGVLAGDSPLQAARASAGTTTAAAQSRRRRGREGVAGASERGVMVFISAPA
ncbi:MAG: hypothetical protein ABI336_03780 [Humibacillus sp.]